MPKKLATLTIIIFILFLPWLGLRLFEVNTVECQLGSSTPCSTELTENLNKILVGRPLFLSNFKQILNGEPFASQPYTMENYSKKLPGTLKVVFNSEPLMYVIKAQDDISLAVGEIGSILPVESIPESTPIIHMNLKSSELSENESIVSSYHKTISSLLDSLYKNGISFQNINWKGNKEIAIDLPENRIALLDANNPGAAIEKLSIILKSGKLENVGEPITEIDLRFQMPVLRTSQ